MSKHFRVEIPLAVGPMVAPTALAHRLSVVLRARPGTHVTLVDLAGVTWSARVTALEPAVLLAIEGVAAGPDRNPAVALEVWVPLLKGGRTDDLVRQLTELGATRIVPFASARAVVKLEPGRREERRARWQAIAREAGNQCGRTELPEIAPYVAGLPASGPGVFLWEGGGAPAGETLAGGIDKILVGPEGGLAPEEADALVAAGWRAATLGARILRAETAVIAFATLALAAAGELGGTSAGTP